MFYAILLERGTVAHLAREKFGVPLCGRAANMTSNAPGGRRLCRDCTARQERAANPDYEVYLLAQARSRLAALRQARMSARPEEES